MVEVDSEVEVVVDPTVLTVVDVASGEEEQAARIRHATAMDRTPRCYRSYPSQSPTGG